MIVHSEMPSEKSSAIVTASEPLIHGERVTQCIGATRRIVGRMNSDKCRTHRPMQGTSAFAWGDDVLRYFQFGCTGGSPAVDCDASGSHRTGRKREAPPGQRQETQMCEVSPYPFLPFREKSDKRLHGANCAESFGI